LSKVQAAGAENQIAQKGVGVLEMIAHRDTEIVVVSEQTSGRQGPLLHHVVVRGVGINGTAQEPVRPGRLSPIKAKHPQCVTKGDGHTGRHLDRGDTGNEAFRGQSSQGTELRQARRRVGDTGILMHEIGSCKEPQVVLSNWSAKRLVVILPGEWLFEVGRRVLDGKARIETGGSLENCGTAVPGVSSAFGADDDRSRSGATSIGVFLRSTDGEFRNRVGRVVLQESSDIVV